jgi:hypothetical protein
MPTVIKMPATPAAASPTKPTARRPIHRTTGRPEDTPCGPLVVDLSLFLGMRSILWVRPDYKKRAPCKKLCWVTDCPSLLISHLNTAICLWLSMLRLLLATFQCVSIEYILWRSNTALLASKWLLKPDVKRRHHFFGGVL